MQSSVQKKSARKDAAADKENVRPVSVGKKTNIPRLDVRRQKIKPSAPVQKLSLDSDSLRANEGRSEPVCSGIEKSSFKVHVDEVSGPVGKACGQRRLQGNGNEDGRRALRVHVQDRSRSVSASRKLYSKHAVATNEENRAGPTPAPTKIARRCPVSERKPVCKGVTPLVSRTAAAGKSSAIANRRLLPSSATKKVTVPTTSVPSKQKRAEALSAVTKQRLPPLPKIKVQVNNLQPSSIPKQRSISVSSIKQRLISGTTLSVPKQRSVSASPIRKKLKDVPSAELPKQRSTSMSSLKKKLMSGAVFGISRQRSGSPSPIEKKTNPPSSCVKKPKRRSISASSLLKVQDDVEIRKTSKRRSCSAEGRITDSCKPTIDSGWYRHSLKQKSAVAKPKGSKAAENIVAAGSCSSKEPRRRLLPTNNRCRVLAMRNPINRLKLEESTSTVLTPVEGLPEPPVPMKVNLHRKIVVQRTVEAPAELDFSCQYHDDLLSVEAEKEKRSLNLSDKFLQRNINAEQRKTLVKFVIHLSSHCDYSTSIIYQAVKLLDVTLDRIPMTTNYMQLVTLAVLWITLKREERLPKIPSATSVIALASDLYEGRQDLLVLFEKKILMALNFNISFADPLSMFSYFVMNCKRKIGFADSLMTPIYYCGSYVIDVTLLEVEFCRISPTFLAAVTAELVLCLILELDSNLTRPFWAFWRNMMFTEARMPEGHRYNESTVKPLRLAIVGSVLRSANRFNHSYVVYKKYRRSRYLHVAYKLIEKTEILYRGLVKHTPSASYLPS